MVSQFSSLENFKILNKLIITKGEEQQAVVKSIREDDFFYVTYFLAGEIWGKKIHFSEIISFEKQSPYRIWILNIKIFLLLCFFYCADDRRRVRLYCIIVLCLTHILFINECYNNYHNELLVTI